MKPTWKAVGAGAIPGFLLASTLLTPSPAPAQQAPATAPPATRTAPATPTTPATATTPPIASAPPAPETPAVPPAPRTESQLQAAEEMKAMAEYLAGLMSFSCTLASRYETVQSNGQKVEFSETRRISLARPDRLRIDEVSDDEDDDDSGTEKNDLTLFDGKQITMLSAGFNVYAQAPQPPSIEDAMVYFVRDLRMRAPLALLLSTHVDTEIPDLAKDVDYVDRVKINGQRAHHVAGRAESVDYEFWIADSNKPVPLRVAITYKTAPGQPRFWADLTDWKMKPKFAANTFKLTLPPGAQQIPFAVQLSALGAQSPDAQQAPGAAATPGAQTPAAQTPAAPAPGAQAPRATTTPGAKP